jgi:hypothetical protein
MSNWITRLFKKDSKYGKDGLTDAERTHQERQRMLNERRPTIENRGYSARQAREVAKYEGQGFDSATANAMYFAALVGTPTEAVRTTESHSHHSDPTPDTSYSSSSSDSSSSYDSGSSSSSSGSFD